MTTLQLLDVILGITSFVIRATYLQNTPLGNSNGQITLYNWIFHWNALKSFKQATVTASRLLVCTCMFCQRIACLFYFKAYLLLIVLTLISIRRQTTLALLFFVEIGIFFNLRSFRYRIWKISLTGFGQRRRKCSYMFPSLMAHHLHDQTESCKHDYHRCIPQYHWTQ